MKPLTIKEISEAVKGKLIQGEDGLKIDNICTDSRKIKPGDLFIALIGDKFDGHSFVKESVNKGAGAVIVEKKVSIKAEAAIISVENTAKALQNLAHYYRMKFDELEVIAITGSVGKTTTKDMIASILQKKYKVLKSSGNFNNYIGLPLSLLSLTGNEDFAVLEMGMSEIGEIERLTEIAFPQTGVITNVGPTHLETLGTVTNVAHGKSELIEGLPSTGRAVLNYDNEYVRPMSSSFKGEKIVYYGLNEKADIYADEIKIDSHNNFSVFNVHYKNYNLEINLNKPGRHNVYNALAAIAVGREYGVGWKDIKQALISLQISSLRMDIKEYKGSKIINDTYNANPLSMQASINVLEGISVGKTVAVLGDMLELGTSKEEAHLRLGEFVVAKEIDFLITVGELAKLIARRATAEGMDRKQIFIVNDNQQAAEKIVNILEPDTTVLIKGSRGMKMEEIVDIVTKITSDEI